MQVVTLSRAVAVMGQIDFHHVSFLKETAQRLWDVSEELTGIPGKFLRIDRRRSERLSK